MNGLPSVSESNYHCWHSSRSRRRLARSSALATQAAAAEKFASAGSWVSHLVLAETLGVLASLYDRNAASLAQTVEFCSNIGT
jgi:hypothetical protein